MVQRSFLDVCPVPFCFANSFAVSFAQIPTCTWPGIHARYTKTFMSNNSSCNDSNFFNHSGFLQYSLPYVAKFTACKQSHKTKRRSGELLFVWDLQYCIAVCNPRTMMAWRLSTWPNCAGPFLTWAPSSPICYTWSAGQASIRAGDIRQTGFFICRPVCLELSRPIFVHKMWQ